MPLKLPSLSSLALILPVIFSANCRIADFRTTNLIGKGAFGTLPGRHPIASAEGIIEIWCIEERERFKAAFLEENCKAPSPADCSFTSHPLWYIEREFSIENCREELGKCIRSKKEAEPAKIRDCAASRLRSRLLSD